MRLEKIKLAGFKSFVDPTVFELRSPLVAVVGPNGCGKSNIIDAIRWVMGESSAKNLRGESMADVIFNGSSTRKPVGQASIELVFDNTDGSLGGEYARFSEISVRREATRDGQSNYFLNGTRCRRKDITDVFLGTGLGPRSYAIIEQGMISRVIEAKPEELRSFLEEAAGVSLYRKRRHETEIRMRHTRENLDRLNDIRQELEKQLDRLKRQSESAEKYQHYKADHDRLEAELSALRWQLFHQQLEEKALGIRNLATALEEKQAFKTSLDLELENHRQTYTEKTDAWKVLQGQFYEIGNQVSRLEQSLQHHREREQSLEQDLQQTKENEQQIQLQMAQDNARLMDLQADWVQLQPESTSAATLLQESEAVLQEADEAMRHWNQTFDVFQAEAEKPQRVAEVEKARIEQLEKQVREAKAQMDRLQKEREGIDVNVLEAELALVEQALLAEDTETNTIGSELNALSINLNHERLALTNQTNRLDEQKGRLQSLKGRLASLEALQQAALGKTNSVVKAWLESNGLLEYPRLGEMLVVETGYETAVETVLGNALEAVCVPGLEAVATLIADLNEGNLAFIDRSSITDHSAASGLSNLLSSKIKTQLPIDTLLAGIHVVDELPEALQKQKSLKPGESIITRAGIWLGSNWLKVYRGTEGHAGVLARESEIKAIGSDILALQEQIFAAETALIEQREKITALESKRESLHGSQQDRARILNELSAKVSTIRTKIEHQKGRLVRLEADAAEQQVKMDQAAEETALSRIHLQKALDEMAEYSSKRLLLQTERDTLRDLLRKASQDMGLAKERAYAVALKEKTVHTQKQAVEEGLERLIKQQQLIEDRVKALHAQLEGLKNPEQEMRKELEILLAKRMSAEDVLNLARAELDELEHTLRTLEKQRNTLEGDIQEIRIQLERLRMDWQAIEIRCQTLQEKFVEMGKALEEVLQTISPEATEVGLVQELEQMIRRIDRLGAINLTAIEEYQSESERKMYLDAQHQDLTEALETLENAIRKIDKETRARFKETFDKVNAEFQALYPRLFGGGRAYLELIGEDLLESGVTVMAQPPGKRNSSIHLLSGGEKALTAVALVFSIFQLNPAPFCLLDEVDAPLDDANVGRYCELVKRLSETVQFIYVTHNKLAMEMAQHLIGVTMKEPGVSRLVSVDVEEAAALVAS